MTSPRPYGGGYYSSPSFPDTPIYDSLVAERGTPQIAPIRVPSAYDSLGGYPHPGTQPALPALPAAPSPAQPAAPTGYSGYQAAPARQTRPAPAPAPTPQPAHYLPQQAAAARPYPAPQAPAPQQMRPAAPRPAAPRPAAPRPAAPRQMPGGYQNPYPTPAQQQPYPGQGYWAEQGPGH
jgi:hypothetical protein